VLHPQSRRALELWAQGPQVTDPGFGPDGISAVRREARAAAAAETREPVHRVEDLDADGVRCRLHVPTAADAHPVLVFLHGGGFVFGDLDTHDSQARRLANRTGAAVLTVDYRRPPDDRFPAAPDDVDTALRWLRRHGPDRGLEVTRTALVGDSAGGNLALVAALRNPGVAAAVVLVYPFLDPDLAGASYVDNDGGGLSREEARWYWEQYAATPEHLADPDLAPLRSDQGRLATLSAPVLLQAAEHDPLLDEDLLLAERLRGAGNDVTRTTYPGMVHGFWRHPALFDAAEEALAEIADFLRKRV
jgi:acetyl esterase